MALCTMIKRGGLTLPHRHIWPWFGAISFNLGNYGGPTGGLREGSAGSSWFAGGSGAGAR